MSALIPLSTFLPYYPDIHDSQFQQKLFNKTEFHQLKLSAKSESVEPGQLLKHQQMIQRFLSPYTQYDELLVYHEMGTGKTCVAFAVSEFVKTVSVDKVAHIIVLAKGQDSLENLATMLVSSCASTYSLDSGPEENERRKRYRTFHRRLVQDAYSFHTFLTFAKELSLLGDDAIITRYSNSVIILDEVHDVKGDGAEFSLVYAQFWRLFHLTRNRKILLLSGTPMTDSVSELSEVMNLILPVDDQLPKGREFMREYFRALSDGTFTFTSPAAEAELGKTLSGRVSYLRAAPSVPIFYQGITVEQNTDIPQFRGVYLLMSDHQKQAYIQAFAHDTSSSSPALAGGGAIYSASRQASLFVFPDGSYGVKGSTAFLSKGRLRPDFRRELKRATAAETLARIAQYSVKYAHVLEQILQARDQNVYVYLSIVNGSGAILFSRLLELFGYDACKGVEAREGKRYILLTSQTKNINTLVRYFNSPRNAQGRFCKVIIGSRKISQGFTFNNILQEHILSLHWNYTETSQAIYRGARFQSHQALQELDPDRAIQVQVAQYVSLPNPDAYRESIDYLMLSYSRTKDISIRRVDRVIKQCSFDCPLTYDRNTAGSQAPGSRECDYQQCEYKCDTGADILTQEDISTFELYYSSYLDIVERVAKVFEQTDALSLEALTEMVRPQNRIELLKALAHLIENNVPLRTRYGSIAYIREFQNRYYLVESPATPLTTQMNDATAAFRETAKGRSVSAPLWVQEMSLTRLTQKLEQEKALQFLGRLENEHKSEQDIHREMETLPLMVQELLLDTALRLKEDGQETWRVKTILSFFGDQLKRLKVKEYDYAVFFPGQYVKCRERAGKRQWVECEIHDVQVIEEEKKDPQTIRRGMEPLPLYLNKSDRFIGIVDEEKFCIQDTSRMEASDARRRTSGAVCTESGWKKNQLQEVWKHFGLPEPAQGWNKFQKKDICVQLRTYLQEKELVKRGRCGTSRKIKPPRGN